MTDIFDAFKSIQATKVGTITQAIIGLILFIFFIINFYSGYALIPNNLMPYFLGYLIWIVTQHLIKAITDLTRSTVKGKKCHYCDGSLEVTKYKCQNCGREQ